MKYIGKRTLENEFNGAKTLIMPMFVFGSFKTGMHPFLSPQS